MLHVPALVRVAGDLGWWSALEETRRPAADDWTSRVGGTSGRAEDVSRATGAPGGAASDVTDGSRRIDRSLDAATWARLRLSPRVVAPADVADAHALVLGALRDGAGSPVVTAATVGDVVVGLVVSAVPVVGSDGGGRGAAGRDSGVGLEERHLLAIGVAPSHRGRGLARDLLRAHLEELASPGYGDLPVVATVTFAERDPVAPIGATVRSAIARRLLAGAGFTVDRAAGSLGRADPSAIVGRLRPRG
jgi:ribosomal protein S18 acetylase RimI-like enzyme